MRQIDTLLETMVAYYAGDPRRIHHFLKVRAFAAMIAQAEALNPQLMEIVDVAAIVHDIGIKIAQEKFGRYDGKLQEQEGPPVAYEMLHSIGYGQGTIDRVCYLVGHHHTYTGIDGIDYRILVEADFLVNMFEDAYSDAAIRSAYEKIFRTERGKWLCRRMYGVAEP